MWKSALFVMLAATLAAEDLNVFRRPEDAPKASLIGYLNSLGRSQLAARRAEVAAMKTVSDVERRKAAVREKILNLIGGLPGTRGPLNAKVLGTLDREGYRIEKIVYESLPGFFVTANVYVPTRGTGPFPAILMPVGHSLDGKGGSRQMAVGMALKGFISLAHDPIGQGERLQYYDPDLRGSKVGGPTDEHTHSNGHTLLIGDNVARYRIWDGIRGIDYLLTRKDVDANRIGCTGCSGGGTLATYISALDDRVKAAAPSCYITSWEALMEGPGPQDAEQTFPNFLAAGLNTADYITLFAPKPWLIGSTVEDFFPLEGARQTYEESRRVYSLFGATDRLSWHIGPGDHGTPKPSREAVYRFFERWLKGAEGTEGEANFPAEDPANLICSRTGQVADSFQSESVYTLNRKRAADLMPRTRETDRQKLSATVRRLASIEVQPGGGAPAADRVSRYRRDGYDVEALSIGMEPGLRIAALLFKPDGAGPFPAFVVVDPRPKTLVAAPGSDVEALVKAGHLVLVVQPRGVPEVPESTRPTLLGDTALAMRAFVVGKTLPGMRAEDIMRATDLLVSRSDVDRSRISAYGRGALAVPVLYAALLDERLRQLVLEDAMVSYRTAVDRPVHRNLYEVAVPGALRAFDIPDVLAALGPARVTLVNPLDCIAKPYRLDGFPVRIRERTDTLASLLPKASN